MAVPALYNWKGRDLPHPDQKVAFTSSTLVTADSGRDELGNMHIKELGVFDQWTLKFGRMKQDDFGRLYADRKSGLSGIFIFPNPAGDGKLSDTYYCGDLTAEFCNYYPVKEGSTTIYKKYWTNVSVTFIKRNP